MIMNIDMDMDTDTDTDTGIDTDMTRHRNLFRGVWYSAEDCLEGHDNSRKFV